MGDYTIEVTPAKARRMVNRCLPLDGQEVIVKSVLKGSVRFNLYLRNTEGKYLLTSFSVQASEWKEFFGVKL